MLYVRFIKEPFVMSDTILRLDSLFLEIIPSILIPKSADPIAYSPPFTSYATAICEYPKRQRHVLLTAIHIRYSTFRSGQETGTLLIALGGHNVGDTIRRMFAKMRTHQLWSQFNMKGRKRKHSFEDLPLHKVICKACRRIHLKCRDDEIEHNMGETLKHAPSKRGGYLFQRYNQPWANGKIRNISRKKKKYYKKAQRTKSDQDMAKYWATKKLVQSECRKASYQYINSMIGESNQNGGNLKKFWSFIKSKKNDKSGVAPLKKNDIVQSDSQTKADILNTQFSSVFMKGDKSNVPNLGTTNTVSCQISHYVKLA
ncbi:hypothetical protein LSAT2_004833 [Lamellibrachia satsuma]|nr:hypothetical protein LSAT2_004833 [Lamellibrachia satsuma]